MTSKEDKISGDSCSPVRRAQGIMLKQLERMHHELFPERDPSDFEITFLKTHENISERSSEELRRWIREANELKHCTSGKLLTESRKEVVKRLTDYVVACRFFMKSMFALERSNDEAWEYLAEARECFGVLLGRMSVRPAYLLASVNADARHKENRSMKAEVFAWLDSLTTKFTVAETAAEAITKQQPIKHITARSWFNEWKKLRSASTQ